MTRRIHHLPWILIILSAGYVLWLHFTAGAIIERGDGVSHYLLARWSWVHPHLLLDPWGKPLFTLLASPFAQFGHGGVAVFNVIMATVAGLLGVHVLGRAGRVATAIYPLLIFFAPWYVMMVLGGMTEPLFGTLTVLVVFLLHRKHHAWAAIVASFMPFARPEAIVFVPCVALWLMLARRWWQLPLLATGWVLYALIGWMVFQDANWYLTNDPYANGPSIYGSGDPWKFTRGMDDITGRPAMILFLAGMVAWPWLRWKDREGRGTADLLLLVCALPTVLIFALHMFLWAKGIKGSAGILRVVSTVVPMAALFAAYVLPRTIGVLFPRTATVGTWAMPVIIGAMAMWSWSDLMQRNMVPIPPNDDEVALREAGAGIAERMPPGAKLFSTHPFMALCADADPYDPERFEVVYASDDLVQRLRPGDVLFWDSELGPNENKIAFDGLWNDPHLSMIGMWQPEQRHKVIRDVFYELYAFQKKNALRVVSRDTLRIVSGRRVMDPVHLDGLKAHNGPCFMHALTVVGMEELGAGALLEELQVVIDMGTESRSEGAVELIYEERSSDRIIGRTREKLTAGENRLVLRRSSMEGAVTRTLGLRAADPVWHCVTDLTLVRSRWTQDPEAGQ